MARPEDESPISAKALHQSRRAIERMIAWLARREITSVRQFTAAAVCDYNEQLKRYPKRGGGVWTVATAHQDRKLLGEFLRWLGGTCPAHPTDAFALMAVRKGDRAEAERLEQSFAVSVEPEPASRTASRDRSRSSRDHRH